jgi:hypothetical protein
LVLVPEGSGIRPTPPLCFLCESMRRQLTRRVSRVTLRAESWLVLDSEWIVAHPSPTRIQVMSGCAVNRPERRVPRPLAIPGVVTAEREITRRHPRTVGRTQRASWPHETLPSRY